MALSQTQNEFIITHANERGSQNSHRAHHQSHVLDDRGFLTIVMQSDRNPAEMHDGSRKDTAGTTDLPDVTADFQLFVDEVMTQALRHFR